MSGDAWLPPGSRWSDVTCSAFFFPGISSGGFEVTKSLMASPVCSCVFPFNIQIYKFCAVKVHFIISSFFYFLDAWFFFSILFYIHLISITLMLGYLYRISDNKQSNTL